MWAQRTAAGSQAKQQLHESSRRNAARRASDNPKQTRGSASLAARVSAGSSPVDGRAQGHGASSRWELAWGFLRDSSARLLTKCVGRRDEQGLRAAGSAMARLLMKAPV